MSRPTLSRTADPGLRTSYSIEWCSIE